MWQCQKCGREFKKIDQDHYCGESNTIDEYITGQPIEVQPLLQKIRETIRAVAPDATEKISWQLPTFWQGENLIHFAAFKKHISIFPGDLTISPFEERLEGYKKARGTVQFPLSKPIDYELIADIARWRVSCVESKRKIQSNNQRSNQSSSKDKGGNKSNMSMDTSRMTRQVYEIPDYITTALDNSGLWESYRARPPYQRNDYIGWIQRGKRQETRQKRLDQMLNELQNGDAYMGMKYRAK